MRDLQPGMQATKMTGVGQSVGFLIANIDGTVLYVFAASRGGWAISEERAAGINVTTGEPFIWFMSVVPVVAVFLVINIAWAITLFRRRWSGARFCLFAAAAWLAAIVIDFAHH